MKYQKSSLPQSNIPRSPSTSWQQTKALTTKKILMPPPSMITDSTLIRQLFGWTKLNAKTLCMELSIDPDVDTHHQSLQISLLGHSSGSKCQLELSTDGDVAAAEANKHARVQFQTHAQANQQNPHLGSGVNQLQQSNQLPPSHQSSTLANHPSLANYSLMTQPSTSSPTVSWA